MQHLTFDRVVCGVAEGRTAQVFDPKWWQVHRWVRWWWRAWVLRHRWGRITFTVQLGVEQHVTRRVRWMELRLPPRPRRIEQQFRQLPARMTDADQDHADEDDGGDHA